MNTKATRPTRKAELLARPPVHHRLLTEHCTGDSAAFADNLDSRDLTIRATTITVLLQYSLDQIGHYHGGLNE